VSTENNGRFPDCSAVLARFSLGDNDEDRDCWPWLEATVEQQCGPDEWLVTIEDWRVAQLEDGRSGGEGLAGRRLVLQASLSGPLGAAGRGRRRAAVTDAGQSGAGRLIGAEDVEALAAEWDVIAPAAPAHVPVRPGTREREACAAELRAALPGQGDEQEAPR
jgi:hypothetical protein